MTEISWGLEAIEEFIYYDVDEELKIIVIKLIPDENGFHKAGIDERDFLLNEVVNDLPNIMNKMGDLINAHELICAIDQRVSAVPFDIVVHGEDYVDEQPF